jgi:hypothetical protein
MNKRSICKLKSVMFNNHQVLGVSYKGVCSKKNYWVSHVHAPQTLIILIGGRRRYFNAV